MVGSSARTGVKVAVEQIANSVPSFIQEVVLLATLTLVAVAQFLIISLAILRTC
jgi:hypothetical protein